MKNSASLKAAVAMVLPFRSLTRLMSLRTMMPSAPRDQATWAGTTQRHWRP